MKFAEHRMISRLAEHITADCCEQTGEVQAYGFLPEKLPQVVHALLAWLKVRACPFEDISPADKDLHWSIALQWRGFQMSASEMESAAAQAVSITFLHMRYLSAYVRFTKAQTHA